jgi:hypothetical protein
MFTCAVQTKTNKIMNAVWNIRGPKHVLLLQHGDNILVLLFVVHLKSFATLSSDYKFLV